MNNQEIISRAISYNNSEINAVKSANDTLSKSLQRKEDKIIELNTDALAGLELPGDVTYPEISGDILLGLFGFDNIGALYYAISNFDNKLFVLKPTLESFNVGSTTYIITNCIPCVGKMIPYGDARIFMLTFIFNTVNTFIGTMTLFVDGHSIGDVKGRISVEELSSGSSSEIPDDISNTITALQGEVDTLKETSVTKTSLETSLETTLETVQQMIKDATNRIDGGIINSNNTPTVSGIGEITEGNDILINEEMLSTGTYTLKYLDGDDNVVNNSKPITNFTI